MTRLLLISLFTYLTAYGAETTPLHCLEPLSHHTSKRLTNFYLKATGLKQKADKSKDIKEADSLTHKIQKLWGKYSQTLQPLIDSHQLSSERAKQYNDFKKYLLQPTFLQKSHIYQQKVKEMEKSIIQKKQKAARNLPPLFGNLRLHLDSVPASLSQPLTKAEFNELLNNIFSKMAKIEETIKDLGGRDTLSLEHQQIYTSLRENKTRLVAMIEDKLEQN